MLPKHKNFLNKFDVKENWCWLWKGSTDTWWYGKLSFYDMWKLKTIWAHRYSYMFYKNKRNFLKRKEHICHTCDNRKCVNPKHLYVWTHSDNMRDRSNAGKHNRWWQLNKKSVITVIDLLDKWMKPIDIAKKLWASKWSINSISQWVSRTHITMWKKRQRRKRK